MVLTGLRKNLVVKEILATGIIRSMRKVLADTQKQVQPYLVTEKVLTVEVNLFHCQTENSSYLHQHQLFIRIYQKERKYKALKTLRIYRHMQKVHSEKSLVVLSLLEKRRLIKLRMFGSTLQSQKNSLKK